MPDACPANVSTGVTTCYWIDKVNGNDANAGTSKAAAWAHSPDMPSWTGSHTMAAGEGFIYKGGVTWNESDLGLIQLANGTALNTIYHGYDPSWYTGGAWTRPIFSNLVGACTNSCGFGMIYAGGRYNVWDNIELQGAVSPASRGPRLGNHGREHEYRG
jgi:hypothetical protein